MRLLACAVLVSGGCSWIAQRHLDGEYTANAEPLCTTSKAFVLVDVLFIANDAAGVVVSALKTDGTDRTASIVGGVVGAVLFAASAVTGNGWANDCRDARETWLAEAAEQQRFDEARARQEMRDELRRKPTPAADPQSPPPRGFFCATSAAQPNAGFCTREKVDCERAHDAASAAVTDLSTCAIVETAWCVGDRCAPTKEACDAAAQRVGAAGAACAEAR